MAEGATHHEGPPAPGVSPRPAAEESYGAAWWVGWYSLLALVFATPLAINNFTFLPGVAAVSFSGPFVVKLFVLGVLSSISLAAWAIDAAVSSRPVRYSAVGWVLLGFVTWAGLSTVLSVHPPTALLGQPGRYEGFAAFVTYAVVFHLTLQYADRLPRVRSLARALVWSSAIVALYGVVQWLGLDPIEWNRSGFEIERAFSTYGNPDFLGGFLMFGLPLSLGLALTEERTAARLALWGAFGTLGLSLMVTFTRGAWIGGVVGVALVAVIAWRNGVRPRGADWGVLAAAAVAIVAVVVRSLSSESPVLNVASRLSSLFEFSAGSGLTRTQIMGAALDSIGASPLVGHGPDTFRLLFPLYRPIGYVADAGYLSVADNAHSYPLHLAAGVGVVGALLLYAAFAWAAVRSAPAVFTGGASGSAGRVVLGSFWAAAAAYLVQMLFGLSTPGSTFALWMAVAVVVGPTARSFVLPAAVARITAVALTCAALAGVALQFVQLTADRHYQLSSSVDINVRLQEAQAAARLNPLSYRYRGEVGLVRAQQYLIAAEQTAAAQAQGIDSSGALQLEREAFALAQTELLDLIEFAPQLPENYVFLATVYNEAAKRVDPALSQKAIEVAERGIAVDPYGPLLRIELAKALAATGQSARAIEVLESAIALDPAFSGPVVALADLYVRLGRSSEAIALLEDAQRRMPADAAIAGALQRAQGVR